VTEKLYRHCISWDMLRTSGRAARVGRDYYEEDDSRDNDTVL